MKTLCGCMKAIAENRAGDARERLTGIEVPQKEQSKTLERILRAIEQ